MTHNSSVKFMFSNNLRDDDNVDVPAVGKEQEKPEGEEEMEKEEMEKEEEEKEEKEEEEEEKEEEEMEEKPDKSE